MVVVKHDVLRRFVRGLLTRTEMREKCYYYFKSQRACCNSIPNQNSCVLLQTEAAGLTRISSQPVERHTESGWNLQAIGLCACAVLGRKEGPCNSGWNLKVIGLL